MIVSCRFLLSFTERKVLTSMVDVFEELGVTANLTASRFKNSMICTKAVSYLSMLSVRTQLFRTYTPHQRGFIV